VTFHRYPERSVLLLFFGAERRQGSAEPRALDVAGFRWAGADELDETSFPPADVTILRKVRAWLAPAR
jgi:8-oxo-dGTP diphosphatase